MTKTFNSASCSGPLEFEGKTTQKCRFCGSTVIPPPELFYASSAKPFGDFSSLTGKALKVAEIDQLVHRGEKIQAIKLFRETFGVGLKEAKDAVEDMERGEAVDISGMQVRSSRAVSDAPPMKINRKWVYLVLGLILFVIVATAIVPVVVGIIAAVSSITSIPATPSPRASGPTPAVKREIAKELDSVEMLKIGGEGTGAGKFKDNRHVAVDEAGRIYSGDYIGGRIQVFDGDGKFLTQWMIEPGINLYDLVADRKGNVYVAYSKGLSVFGGTTGTLLKKADKIRPLGLALTLDGKVFASNGRDFFVLDGDLKPIREFKDAAKSADSTSGLDRLAVDGNGFIFALDRNKNDICKFSPDGKFLDRFSSHTQSPHAIALDPKGRLFVAETNSIKAVDEKGTLIKSLDATQAFGLAFNDEGELFVAGRPYVFKYLLNF